MLLNLLVFAYLQWGTDADFGAIVHYWAFSPVRIVESIKQFELIASLGAIFRSMFTHLTLTHLMGNMIPVVAIGMAIAKKAGNKTLLTTFFMGGFLAAIGTIALEPDNSANIIGASGAAAALYGFYLLDTIRNAKKQDHLQWAGLILAILIVAALAGRFHAHMHSMLAISPDILPRILDKIIIVSFFAGIVMKPRVLWTLAIVLWILANCYNLAMESLGLYETGSSILLHLFGVLAGVGIAWLKVRSQSF